MSSDRTRLGLQAARAGDRREARRIFATIVREKPDDAMAWWNLADVTDDSEQKAQCLRQVLKIMPDYEPARRLLSSVEQQVARQTPAKGFSRPVAEADSKGAVWNPSTSVLEPVVLPPARDLRVPLAIVAVLVVLSVMVLASILSRAVPQPVPTATAQPHPGLTLNVQQCVTTGISDAVLMFSNQSGHPITLSIGAAGQEVQLGKLPAGAEQSVEAAPGDKVRYSATADDDATLSGGATIEVPAGSSCTVPIK